MRVLISGATGFLGQALLPQLAGNEILAIARNPLSDSPVDWIVSDLSKPGAISRLPPADVVIHLAQSSLYRSFPDGMPDMVAVNVDATTQLLEYARSCGARQFLLASTGSVYDPSHDEMREDAPVSPSGAYPASKLAGELLTAPYRQFFKVAVFRLFFLYGPGQQNMMIPNIINTIASGGEVTLQGDEGGLEFCPSYVDDVARVFASAIENEVDGTYNVACPETVSLRSVAEEIGRCLGVEPRFRMEPDKQPAVFRPSLDRLREWYDVDSSFRSFSEGIAETIRSTELEQG